MSIADCADCLIFFEKISEVSKKQLEAISARDEAVQKEAMEAEVSALAKQAEFWASERQRAMERYRLHQRRHSVEQI